MRMQLAPPWRLAASPITVRGTSRARQAVRVRVHDREGHSGLGEALPLPGYSRDDAESAERVLASLFGAALNVPDTTTGAARVAGIAAIAAALAPFEAALAASPSARFALECALLDLLARRAGHSAAAWLADGRALQRVPVSVLLPDEAAAAVAAAGAAARRGHRVLKLKVARADRSAAQEAALLAAVRAAADAAAPGAVRLRLDANGELFADTLVQRLHEWAAYGIELIEEPLAGDALLGLPPLPLPWAADESLADAARAAALLTLPRDRGPSALVLKPALLGLVRCFALADAAAARGIGVIVTHALDGDIGLAAACALAQVLPMAPLPCGLAPHAGLRRATATGPELALPAAQGLGDAAAA